MNTTMKSKAELEADVIVAAKKLAAQEAPRGCHCEYDYRCGNCERILDLCYAVEDLENNAVEDLENNNEV